MFPLNFHFVDGISKFLLFTNTIVLYDVDHTLVNDNLLEWILHTFPSDNVIKQALCNPRQSMSVAVLHDNRQICCNDVFIFFSQVYNSYDILCLLTSANDAVQTSNILQVYPA